MTEDQRCKCQLCKPGRDAYAVASERLAMRRTATQATIAAWPQTQEFDIEVLRVRIDMLEEIIRCHVSR